jgi:hypothetical protein
MDVDGVLHLAKAIWRLSAQLQLDVEASRDVADPIEEQVRAVRAEGVKW